MSHYRVFLIQRKFLQQHVYLRHTIYQRNILRIGNISYTIKQIIAYIIVHFQLFVKKQSNGTLSFSSIKYSFLFSIEVFCVTFYFSVPTPTKGALKNVYTFWLERTNVSIGLLFNAFSLCSQKVLKFQHYFFLLFLLHKSTRNPKYVITISTKIKLPILR